MERWKKIVIIFIALVASIIVYCLIYVTSLSLVAGDRINIVRDKMPWKFRINSTPFPNVVPDANSNGISLTKTDSQGSTFLKTVSAGANMLMNSSDDGTIFFAASALAQGSSPIQLELVVGGPNPTCASLSDAITKAQASQKASEPVVIFVHPGVYTGPLMIPTFKQGFHLCGLVPNGVNIQGQVTISASVLASFSNLNIIGNVIIQNPAAIQLNNAEISFRSVSVVSKTGASVMISADTPTSGGSVNFRDSVLKSTGDMCVQLTGASKYQLSMIRCEADSGTSNLCIKNEGEADVTSSFCGFIGKVPTDKFRAVLGYTWDRSLLQGKENPMMFQLGNDSMQPMTIGGKVGVFPGMEPLIRITTGEENQSISPDVNGFYHASDVTLSPKIVISARERGSRFFVLNRSNVHHIYVESGNTTDFAVNGETDTPFEVGFQMYYEFITVEERRGSGGYIRNMVLCNSVSLSNPAPQF